MPQDRPTAPRTDLSDLEPLGVPRDSDGDPLTEQELDAAARLGAGFCRRCGAQFPISRYSKASFCDECCRQAAAQVLGTHPWKPPVLR